MRYNICNCVKSALLVTCLLFQSQTEATRLAKRDHVELGGVHFKVANEDKKNAVNVRLANDLALFLIEKSAKADSPDVCEDCTLFQSQTEAARPAKRDYVELGGVRFKLANEDEKDVNDVRLANDLARFLIEKLAKADSPDVCVQNAMSPSLKEELARVYSPGACEKFMEILKRELAKTDSPDVRGKCLEMLIEAFGCL